MSIGDTILMMLGVLVVLFIILLLVLYVTGNLEIKMTDHNTGKVKRWGRQGR